MLSSVVRKALLAGLGVRVVVNRVVDDLVKKGETDPDRQAARFRDLMTSCEQSARKVEAAVADGVSSLGDLGRFPRRSDLDALERKVQDLARKVDELTRPSSTPRV